jgi:multisubunit Na+/H+ antiporter MnhG subunit
MLILSFVIFTGPTAIHALAAAARISGVQPSGGAEGQQQSNT